MKLSHWENQIIPWRNSSRRIVDRSKAFGLWLDHRWQTGILCQTRDCRSSDTSLIDFGVFESDLKKAFVWLTTLESRRKFQTNLTRNEPWKCKQSNQMEVFLGLECFWIIQSTCKCHWKRFSDKQKASRKVWTVINQFRTFRSAISTSVKTDCAAKQIKTEWRVSHFSFLFSQEPTPINICLKCCVLSWKLIKRKRTKNGLRSFGLRRKKKVTSFLKSDLYFKEGRLAMMSRTLKLLWNSSVGLFENHVKHL